MHPRSVLLLVASSLVASCASQTRLAGTTRQSISARHEGTTVALRWSCYYGDLYDENEMWLLTPYPFAETSHIADTHGAPIHPTGQRGIVPAGSTFVVERIEFPDASAMGRRMLTTPRYNPWIYLTPTSQTPAPSGRQHVILLLPMDLDSEARVESAFASLLAAPDEEERWLAARRPTVRAAILNKAIVVGMSLVELTAAMGPAQRWFHDTEARGALAQVAWYPSQEAWLVDDIVVETRPSRQVPLQQEGKASSSNEAGATKGVNK